MHRNFRYESDVNKGNFFSQIGRELDSLSGEPDYFGRNKISSGGDLSHYSSASLY